MSGTCIFAPEIEVACYTNVWYFFCVVEETCIFAIEV